MSALDQSKLSGLDKFLWAVIGLLLTIAGTFIPANLALPIILPQAGQIPLRLEAVYTYPLQVTYQIGAVLLAGCMGGAEAATLSQIAYLTLGLSSFPIFAYGGGLGYLQEPTFGYLLGFIPAAWLCGSLAFRQSARLETLTLSSFAGLVVIHAIGLVYLSGLVLFKIVPQPWWSAVTQYSLHPLPGQLIMVCIVGVVARFLRLILFY